MKTNGLFSSAALVLAGLSGACSQSQLPTVYGFVPGDAALSSVALTDAVVASRGKFRVELRYPVAADTAVNLTNTDQGVATFPASVTVLMGHSSVEGEFSGVSPGSFVLSTSLGSASLQATGTVVAAVALSGLSVSSRMVTQASSIGSVSLNTRVSADEPVTLVSSDPAVVAVPATAIISAYSSSATFAVKAVASGTAVITATRGSVSASSVVTVTDTNGLSSVSVSPNPVLVGQPAVLRLVLLAAATSDVTVALESADPNVAKVPASAVVPAGTISVSLPITVSGPGQTTVTAAVGAEKLSTPLQVLQTNGLSSISISPSTALIGQTSTLRLSLLALGASDVTVALESSNTSVATVPASATIPAGTSSVLLPVTASGSGRVTIFATVGAVKLSTTLQVLQSNVLSSVSASPSAVLMGQAVTLYLSLLVATPSDVTVALESSDPGVATVPASATIVAGTSSVQLPVTAAGPGRATLSATVGTTKLSTTLQILQSNGLSSVGVSSNPALVGKAATFYVYLLTTTPTDVTVALESSDPKVATVPASVIIPAGMSSASVPVTALGAGQVSIAATVGTTKLSSSLQVLLSNAVRYVYCDQVWVGTSAACSVNLQATAPVDSPVSISVAPSGALTVPASVIVPTGTNGSSFSVTGGSTAGSATLTATLGSSHYDYTFTVLANGPATISQVYISPYSSVLVGTDATIGVYLTGAASSDTTVSITSSNPSVLAPPSSMVIARGSTSASVRATYKSAGFSVITASIPGGSSVSTVVSATASGTLVSRSMSLRMSTMEKGYIGYLALNASQQTDAANTTITTGTPNVISFAGTDAGTPLKLVWPAGQTNLAVPFTAVGAGQTLVTTSVAGELLTATATVVDRAAVSSISTSQIGVSSTGTIYIDLNAYTASDYGVDLTQNTSSGGSIAGLPAHVVIPTGQSSSQFRFKGQTAGTVTVTATTSPDGGSSSTAFPVGP